MGKEVLLKNIEILNAFQAIQELTQVKLPTKVSWNISKNMKKIETAFNGYIEFETKLVKEYATKDSKGNLILDDKNQPSFDQDNKNEYIKQRSELLNLTDTISILPVKISDLDGVDLKPTTLFSLDFMIEDDEE